MSLVNKIANDRNIPTVDYQHAVYQITILFIITMRALVHCIKNISPIIFFHGENIDLKDIKIIINAE